MMFTESNEVARMCCVYYSLCFRVSIAIGADMLHSLATVLYYLDQKEDSIVYFEKVPRLVFEEFSHCRTKFRLC